MYVYNNLQYYSKSLYKYILDIKKNINKKKKYQSYTKYMYPEIGYCQ